MHSAEPWHYRNRTRVHVKHEPAFALGYFRNNSHELLAIERVRSAHRSSIKRSPLFGSSGRTGQAPVSLHGLQFFANQDDSKLLVEVYVRPQTEHRNAELFAKALMASLAAIAGVAIFATSRRRRRNEATRAAEFRP